MKKHLFFMPIIIGTLLLISAVLFWPTEKANAQCGSQASSCKNCHEVQAKDPVNNDGTGWHQSHAFGDFCYICHAGNNQSMVEDEAHTGMVPPLSDVKAACQACHPDDLMDRAQVYATALGVEVGSEGSSTSSGANPSESTPSEPSQPSSIDSEINTQEMVVSSSAVIDYSQRYEEVVTGRKPVNWGNVIVGVFIVFMLVGGGGFVFWNERKLHGMKAPMIKKATVKADEIPLFEGYSPEVTGMLPMISRLNPVGLHALKRLLENPEDASDLLQGLSKLDPDLVRQMRKLDRHSRAMLLALSGD